MLRFPDSDCFRKFADAAKCATAHCFGIALPEDGLHDVHSLVRDDINRLRHMHVAQVCRARS